MPVTDYLRRNAKEYADEIALVELNPEMEDTRRVSWKEYDLIEPPGQPYRREITWKVFDEKANRFANMLISRGIKKGDKVAIINLGTFVEQGEVSQVMKHPKASVTRTLLGMKEDEE